MEQTHGTLKKEVKLPWKYVENLLKTHPFGVFQEAVRLFSVFFFENIWILSQNPNFSQLR